MSRAKLHQAKKKSSIVQFVKNEQKKIIIMKCVCILNADFSFVSVCVCMYLHTRLSHVQIKLGKRGAFEEQMKMLRLMMRMIKVVMVMISIFEC